MKPSPLSCVLTLALVLGAGCDVLNTSDAEGTRGRGARAFDPYASSASGAISLSLLSFQGCAVLPSGEPVASGTRPLPGYPAACQNINSGFPPGPPAPPTAKFNVTPGALYFLRELTVMDAAINVHTNFTNRQAPATWMRKQSLFKSLDWSGLAVGRDEWRLMSDDAYRRETYFENAAWMTSSDDTFLLEVLDADGNVRAEQTYKRTDFLAETSVTGRTRVSWAVNGIGRPNFPGDPELHRVAKFGDPVFHTGVKVSLANSTNPFKSFTMPQLTGEGAIRVTWSLMKDAPFYFPVNFVPEAERPATCYRLDADGLATSERVPCGFGLEQAVRMNTPANGQFFQPGDTLDFQVSLQDGDGHALHSRDLMPSFDEYLGDESNGLGYFNEGMLLNFRDTSSSESGFKVVGPLQDLKVVNGTYSLPYFAFPELSEPKYYVAPGTNVIPGGNATEPPTRYAVKLPENARAGTYAVVLKGHRSFMGERLNRMDPFFFQVGQAEPTTYPGRVGNCQLCHNGVNSLSNLHHGVSVDHVELCKTCHFDASVGHISEMIHSLHINSRKYAQNKGDCTLCHLTRESTLRPSLIACNSCHLTSHGTDYFDLQFAPLQVTPNAYGNCANACHVAAPPAEHVLPKN
ncbi:hypothetical protein [Pyxidicoccus caerfyrddinensis]|uniref:hypothetical protein n=1 Tax=Pyxidicoccus caerfyrddinensis TaxID=2709663 RepID=UPI0013DD82CC|nr:hypothetical protein [Pyxidicoccus caerfyrddinensis]